MTIRARIAVLTVLTLVAALLSRPTPAAALPNPCIVPGPSLTNCAGLVTFSSHVPSATFRPVQAVPGTNVQPDIFVTFNTLVRAVRVWVNDPDYPNNRPYLHLYQWGYVQLGPVFGDNNPGWFSTETVGLRDGFYDGLRLDSDGNDYVNWLVEYQRESDPNGPWCRVNAQSTSCQGVTATVSPYTSVSSVFDPFQSLANGTGPQMPIDVTFEIPQYSVVVTAVDTDFPGSRMELYAASGALLGSVDFANDNQPGRTNVSTKSWADTRGIARVRLVPAPNDYVAFQGLCILPL